MDEEIPVDEIKESQPKTNSAMKSLGIAAGIGLAVGASALGAHTLMKSKEDDEDEEDYDYDE